MGAVGARAAPEKSYVLVGGESIDWALGNLLGRRPGSGEQPRWERVVDFARQWSNQDASARARPNLPPPKQALAG